MILLILFNLGLHFKTENLFGAQFDELEKCIQIHTRNICTKM